MKSLVALIVPALLLAQVGDSLQFKYPAVRAQGSATLEVMPDTFNLDVGVVTQAATAQAAGAANAKQASAVVAELKKLIDKNSRVQTVRYSLTPNYKYSKEGGSPTITGYTATNVLRVTTRDMTLGATLIDSATKAGANNVQGVHFSLENESAVRGRALREAAQQARQNAEAMASGLGLKVTRILRVEDAAPVQVLPVREMAMMRSAAMADAPPTPVEPGNIRVEATVTVTAEVTAQ